MEQHGRHELQKKGDGEQQTRDEKMVKIKDKVGAPIPARNYFQPAKKAPWEQEDPNVSKSIEEQNRPATRAEGSRKAREEAARFER